MNLYKRFNNILILLMILPQLKAQTTSLQQAIRLSAQTEESPAKIILTWPLFTDGNQYNLYKRQLGDETWGNSIATIPISDTHYVDNDITAGIAYEYKITRIKGGYITAFGYLWSGVNVPETDFRGALLLIIDEAYKDALSFEIGRLMEDIRGDGWRVLHIYVNRNDSIPAIKDRINEIYNQNNDLKTLFLLGRIPVPFSGNFTIPPDGHVVGSGSHTSAWPADVYYADLDGIWTDETVTDTSAARKLAWNIPGDGKFDQTFIPSAVELEIGRVDLFNMPEFSKNDTALIKFYLDKNHLFRTGQLMIRTRGLVDDNFTGLNLASTGWDNLSATIGHWNIDVVDYFTSMKNNSYLWSYGCGAGSFTSCAGLKNGTARTTDFVNDSVNTVFTILAGSYFGDWDNTNNFLRAPLASKPYALASFWGGIPKWHVFHMGLGMHIGYGCKITQNNTDYTNQYFTGLFNYSHGKVHIALMGDPSLRMHPVAPPSNLLADSIGNVTCQLTWTPSPDSVLYYNIYRTTSLDKAFGKINKTPVTSNTYIDDEAENGKSIYMVRAVRLEKSPSGTYYNMSQGIIDSASTHWRTGIDHKPMTITALSIYPNPAINHLHLYINSVGYTDASYTIQNLMGQEISAERIDLIPGANTFPINITAYGKGIYFISVKNEDQVVVKKLVIQ